MAKKTPENLLEKDIAEHQSSIVRWKMVERLSESLGDSDDWFVWCIELTDLDWAVHELENYMWLSSEVADLLLWVSSCDKLKDLALKIWYRENYIDSEYNEEERRKDKRLMKKYQEIGDNESLESLIHDMNLDQENQTKIEKTMAFLLRPQKVEKYISAVAANMDSFTKISVKWLKVLADAWYSDKVSEYVRNNKKYAKKS